MLARELRTVSDASGLLRVSRRLDIDTRSAARQDEHVMGGHVVALVIIVGLPAMATVHRALPLRVVDGDTFRLHGERIRILGIDTPERGEPGSGRATYRLLALLRSGNVVIVRHGKDVYCRTLADVYVDGWNVAAVLRAEGYAKPLPTARRPRRPAATTPPNVPRRYDRSAAVARYPETRVSPERHPRRPAQLPSVRCRRLAGRRAGGGARSSRGTRACRSWDSPTARSPTRRRAGRIHLRW